MDTHGIINAFARIGAKARFDRVGGRNRSDPAGVRIDIRTEPQGEVYLIDLPRFSEPAIAVPHIRPDLRHLLLSVREGDIRSRFLCGHDERHWFVAAVPENAPGVASVEGAIEALKPDAVRSAQRDAGLRTRDRMSRKNKAFIRQGEWFFVPDAGFAADPLLILRAEPLSRGIGSKPHIAEECYRSGGTTVWVNDRYYPGGISEKRYRRLVQQDTKWRALPWRIMRRDPEVRVRGRIRHPDHKTVRLDGWHRVFMNTENQSAAMRHVVFLD